MTLNARMKKPENASQNENWFFNMFHWTKSEQVKLARKSTQDKSESPKPFRKLIPVKGCSQDTSEICFLKRSLSGLDFSSKQSRALQKRRLKWC